ncbi:MAG: class F sortase [Dehalococcoidia bacterium]
MGTDRKLFAGIGAALAALLAGGAVIGVAAIAGVGPFSSDDDNGGNTTENQDNNGDDDGGDTIVNTPQPGDDDDDDVVIPPSDAPIQRVIVEAANIDNASVLTLGLQADNATFEVPTNATQVAWYDFSGLPGEEGKAPILAAHVDYQGQRGPFYTLTEATEGSNIYLVMADGTIYQYRVVSNRDINKTTLSWEDVGCDPTQCFAADVITLITCGGNFNPRTRSYNDNIVVRAELVGTVEESELPA